MKRFLGAALLASGIGVLLSQSIRMPIYAASGFQNQQSSPPASPVAGESTSVSSAAHTTDLAKAGGSLFDENCSFCHGRDAMGGETGPDLTRSKLVLADVGGDKISEVVRDGRPQKNMPSFNFSSDELLSLLGFIHAQAAKAASQNGKRRGVDVSDLQTGNIDQGKQYFDGAG